MIFDQPEEVRVCTLQDKSQGAHGVGRVRRKRE